MKHSEILPSAEKNDRLACVMKFNEFVDSKNLFLPPAEQTESISSKKKNHKMKINNKNLPSMWVKEVVMPFFFEYS